MAGVLASRKGLKFMVKESGELPKKVYTDANRLKQILLNLLSNAIKFTNQGFVKLQIQKSYADQLHLAIIDSGTGISRENIGRLFT